MIFKIGKKSLLLNFGTVNHGKAFNEAISFKINIYKKCMKIVTFYSLCGQDHSSFPLISDR